MPRLRIDTHTTHSGVSERPLPWLRVGEQSAANAHSRVLSGVIWKIRDGCESQEKQDDLGEIVDRSGDRAGSEESAKLDCGGIEKAEIGLRPVLSIGRSW